MYLFFLLSIWVDVLVEWINCLLWLGLSLMLWIIVFIGMLINGNVLLILMLVFGLDIIFIFIFKDLGVRM